MTSVVAGYDGVISSSKNISGNFEMEHSLGSSLGSCFCIIRNYNMSHSTNIWGDFVGMHFEAGNEKLKWVKFGR